MVSHRLSQVLLRLLLAWIGLYRATLGSILPPMCRFEPSCSRFAEEALKKYGIVQGGRRAALRLLRCHPLHSGGFDPVD